MWYNQSSWALKDNKSRQTRTTQTRSCRRIAQRKKKRQQHIKVANLKFGRGLRFLFLSNQCDWKWNSSVLSLWWSKKESLAVLVLPWVQWHQTLSQTSNNKSNAVMHHFPDLKFCLKSAKWKARKETSSNLKTARKRHSCGQEEHKH